jgi:SAM-dependent methyltransferase
MPYLTGKLVAVSSGAGRLIVPDSAIKYILFQRTAYIRLPVARIDSVLRRLSRRQRATPAYNLGIALESRFARGRTRTLYAEDMEREYQSIRNVLPPVCASVLDIGCGVAGIDVFVQRHYGEEDIDFFLLDRSEVTMNVFYSFQSHGAFYNSLETARTLMTLNGVPAERIHLLEATPGMEIRITGKVDLIISLLSWGFHYPVNTYLSRVHDLLSENGVLVMDIRKGSDGLKLLRDLFPRVDIVQSTLKYDRVAARKR